MAKPAKIVRCTGLAWPRGPCKRRRAEHREMPEGLT